METTQKTAAQEALQAANDECSKFCFEIGRLHWQMKINQREAEDFKVKLHNLEVDLEKATDAYKKAQKAAAAEYHKNKSTVPDVPELSPTPQLEVVQ